MEPSKFLNLNLNDIKRGVIMAVFMGFALPITAAIQTPGFDLFTANYAQILNLALNGAVMGFFTYLAKNVFTASNGKLFGKI